MRLDQVLKRLSPAEKRFIQFANNKFGKSRRWTWWFVGGLDLNEVRFCIDKALTLPGLKSEGRKVGRQIRWDIDDKLGVTDRQIRRSLSRRV